MQNKANYFNQQPQDRINGGVSNVKLNDALLSYLSWSVKLFKEEQPSQTDRHKENRGPPCCNQIFTRFPTESKHNKVIRMLVSVTHSNRFHPERRSVLPMDPNIVTSVPCVGRASPALGAYNDSRTVLTAIKKYDCDVWGNWLPFSML